MRLRRRGHFAEEDLIPIDAEIGHDAQLAAGAMETARGTAIVLGLPAGMPISRLTVTHWPWASCICRYGITSPSLNSWEAPRKVLPSGQSTQPLSSSTALAGGRGARKVQVDRVQFGHAQFGALELSPGKPGPWLRCAASTSWPSSSRALAGVDALLDAEEPELGVGWTLKFLVGEDFRAGGMIDGVQHESDPGRKPRSILR